jgi:hypothetical protein
LDERENGEELEKKKIFEDLFISVFYQQLEKEKELEQLRHQQ